MGDFENDNIQKVILHTQLLIKNLIKNYETYCKGENSNNHTYLKEKMSIDLIINDTVNTADKEIIKEKINRLNKFNYKITIYHKKELLEHIDKAYQETL